MSDNLFQNFSTVQSNQQPSPNTIVTAATIAPVTFLTFVSGTTPAIATITPPVTGQHMLAIVNTDNSPATYLTTGNILTALVPTPNIPTLFIYDPAQAKYYAMAGNLT